jgi:hypothetical protein
VQRKSVLPEVQSVVLLPEALLHRLTIGRAFREVVSKASDEVLPQDPVVGVALWREMRVLDADRMFAEEVEEACVTPVPVDNAADLGWHALLLSHE